MELLKLIAFDEEDLRVLSAHLQDSVVKVSDILWRPTEGRAVLVLNRFDWEEAQGAPARYQRRRAALRFERVKSFKASNLTPARKDLVLNLLTVAFAETDPPAGLITLTFSGGPALRFEVECIEAELADLGPVWATGCCPNHASDVAPK